MKFHLRTHVSEKWTSGPIMNPFVIKALFDEFSSNGYVSYCSLEASCVIFILTSSCLLDVIDGLKKMTDDKFKEWFWYDDPVPIDNREYVISMLEDLYDNRDMDWCGGNSIYLLWR